MIFGRTSVRLILVVCFFFCVLPCSSHGAWTGEKIGTNSLSLDTIWGTSDTNIYAISFAGKVFHKGELGWTDITATLFTDATKDRLYLPYGVWGTDSANVYITGTIIDYSVGADALTMGTPFVFRFNGTNWTRIPLDIGPVLDVEDKFHPNWITGICGTSMDDMYFTGGKFIEVITEDGEKADPVTAGIVLHYNASAGAWTGEVGVGDLVNADYTEHIPMINEITGQGDDLYAVGLKGLILHKTLSTGVWEIMPTESLALNFFRVWGPSAADMFAVGFNSSSAAAVIYRYNGTAWAAMTIPSPRSGYIPALWGIWGENANKVHCVGNAGNSLYYDGNPGNIWKVMISDTTTSLNSAWGTDFNNVYAGGEDGKIYHFTEGIKTNGLRAFPRVAIAPQSVEFTDISAGEVDRWTWDFGEGSLESIAPTADIDYKILVTAITGPSLNGAKIVVDDNKDASGTYLENVEAVSARADLGDDPDTAASEGLILVKARPGSKANSYSIFVEEALTKGGLTATASIYCYQYGIYLKINPETTTQNDMAELLETLTDIVASAVPDTPDALWAASSPASSSARFTGGQNYTINVKIDSGVTTHAEIASVLKTHDKIENAVADSPSNIWTRGTETVSNKATFSGGLLDRNTYVNTDTTIENYYMATHTYKTPGDYTANLTIHRPDIPASGEILVKSTQRPDVLDYNQAMALVSVPGTLANGLTVSIKDGGPDCIPGITWDANAITLTLASGVTSQWEAADLLMKHPLILAAAPSVPDDPWYSSASGSSDTATFYNGLSAGTETSELAVKILKENPLDFTVSPAEGVKTLTAVFKDNSSEDIKNKIIKWIWYFNYASPSEPGSADDGSIIATYSLDTPVSFTYNSIGTYNIYLVAYLDDNSPFSVFKKGAVTVKSADEDKNSLEGGSGLDSASGCFIDSLPD